MQIGQSLWKAIWQLLTKLNVLLPFDLALTLLGFYPIYLKIYIPGGSDDKESATMQETRFDPWVGKISWRRERLPTPVFSPGEFHGLYSPWGCKESDNTEQLSLSLFYTISTEKLSCA